MTDACLQLLNGTDYDGYAKHRFWRAEWLSAAWDTFFGPAGLGKIPEEVRCSVTAEFFVTRERIQAHPREFYLKNVEYIMTAGPKYGLNSYTLGCIYEIAWHFIFGEPAYMEGLTIQPCDLFECNTTEIEQYHTI